MSLIDRSASIFAGAMKLRQVGRAQIGRLLGSVPSTSGGYKALIELIERSYFMRAELNVMVDLLIDRGIISEAEWKKRIDVELGAYLRQVAAEWPEMEFNEDGYVIKDPKALAEHARREGW